LHRSPFYIPREARNPFQLRGIIKQRLRCASPQNTLSQ
jgi:hypothetical protein